VAEPTSPRPPLPPPTPALPPASHVPLTPPPPPPYLNFKLIFPNRQYYRLITTFLYFGEIRGVRDVIHLGMYAVFLVRHCRSLEESFYRNRPADFLWMLLVGGAAMVGVAATQVVPEPMLWLSNPLSVMLMYVWSRRNRGVMMNMMGVLNFPAPWLPWVNTLINVALGHSLWAHVLGIAVGHVYWYLEDVVPHLLGGRRPLRTPSALRVAMGQPPNGLPPLPPIRPVAGARIVRYQDGDHAHQD